MKILIIDIETTGFLPNGKIVEIGIVRLNLKTGKKKLLYDQVINPEIDFNKLENSWICQKGYMHPLDIIDGKLWKDVKDDVQDIIKSHKEGVTAFNRRFDMTFLRKYGIVFGRLLPCPMLQLTPIMKLPHKDGRKGNKWPKVIEAYKYLFPKSEYDELHRGADDAMHEADIVFALHKMNRFL